MPADDGGAAAFVPTDGDLATLREAARSCQGCGLYRDATQAVFGAGAAPARVLMAGEQPGDVEDRKGEPFVGPAGAVLSEALAEAGIDRDSLYLTNVVKHFKFVPPERGKRRIHKKPSQAEVTACWPWLAAEIRAVRPRVVVCLGATAAKALFGTRFRVTRERGVLLDFPVQRIGSPAPELALATIHPSAVLRADDREQAYRGLMADLRVVADACS